ncbi:hypothetical protein MKW98_030153 [Papaver atlanticum]|uniref:Uncharacterized protein n=1 Tax=Papaver atlanticum TaxID=357466 RepID=A0AAD4SSV2_9MAGN|nr:hypothetical protein MKW98_030153 [Papaver atlanticum]
MEKSMKLCANLMSLAVLPIGLHLGEVKNIVIQGFPCQFARLNLTKRSRRKKLNNKIYQEESESAKVHHG